MARPRKPYPNCQECGKQLKKHHLNYCEACSPNRAFEPTPEQIRAMCLEIQSEWSPEAELYHRVGPDNKRIPITFRTFAVGSP